MITGASFVQMHIEERNNLAVSFMLAVVVRYEPLGMKIKWLIMDDGSAYRLQMFFEIDKALGIEHLLAKPQQP